MPFDALNSPDYYSVYPPVSQLTFRAAVALAGPDASWQRIWWVLKGLMVAFELLALLLLARMATARALLVYAWHPLAVLEIAGQAHTEAAMLPALVLAALVLAKPLPGRWARVTAGGALAWATMVKLVPLVLAPLALRKGGGWAVAGGLAVGGLLAWPYAAPFVIPNVRESVDLYVRYFEFNAGPYFALKALGQWATGEDVSKTLGPALRSVFVLGMLPLWAAAWVRRWDFATAALVGWAWFFATSTTVHPWYVLGPLVLVPLVMEQKGGARVAVAWATLAAGSAWTYALYAGLDLVYWIAVIAFWFFWFLVLTSAYGHAGLRSTMARRGARKWRWMADHLPNLSPQTRVLDLGAGEGFVGAAAQASTGSPVTLCDVTDFNETDLPHVQSDGHTLPFASDSFDVVLLAFVLHHAEDAERGAGRSVPGARAGGRVAVLESVAETRRDDRILHVLDPLANRLRSGGLMAAQEEHLRFRSTAAWREAFLDCRIRGRLGGSAGARAAQAAPVQPRQAAREHACAVVSRTTPTCRLGLAGIDREHTLGRLFVRGARAEIQPSVGVVPPKPGQLPLGVAARVALEQRHHVVVAEVAAQDRRAAPGSRWCAGREARRRTRRRATPRSRPAGRRRA